MIITLFQPDINDCACDNAEIAACLDEAQNKRSDLLIFPEYYPYWEGKGGAPAFAEICDGFKTLSAGRPCAFIAGGLAVQDGALRNFCCLFHNGMASSPYFKQRKFGDELDPASEYFFKPGERLEKFEWNNHAVIPLICADAIETLGKPMEEFARELAALGAGKTVPVVVLSYAKKPLGFKWTEALQGISDHTDAPVLFCNYSGTDQDGYGGGGSGLFMPGRPPARNVEKSALFTYKV